MLYISNHIKPKAFVVKRCGSGFGGGWTDFRLEESHLGKLINQNIDLLPEYFATDGGCWTQYNNVVWSNNSSLWVLKQSLVHQIYTDMINTKSEPMSKLLGVAKDAPKWLYTFEFNIHTILQDSLYYPASGFDLTMVDYFHGSIYSFVSVDYSWSRDDLMSDLYNKRFKDFKIIYQKELTPSNFIPNSWKFKPDSPQLMVIKEIKPFCEWMIFENSNHERFSLLYICAEGVTAYDDLYGKNHATPLAIAFRRSESFSLECGFSFNWTKFLTKISGKPIPMEVIVNKRVNHIPNYLIVDNKQQWEKYTEKVGVVDGLTIWTCRLAKKE